jgi:hypothetical protein
MEQGSAEGTGRGADGPYFAGSTRSKLSAGTSGLAAACRQCRPSEGVRLVPKSSVGLARLAPTRGAEGEKKDAPTCLFLRFFEISRSDFRKYFYRVVGLPMLRNGQKRDKKNRWEKTTGKKFLTWTSHKKFLMVFLNSLVEKRHKNAIKKPQKKRKKKGLPHLVAICQIYVAFKKKSFVAP